MDITVLGLQNSGKTTLLRVLGGEEFMEDTIPTIGFSLRRIRFGNVHLSVWDLGGQKRFQSMWERYARGVDAILFIVDSADPDRFAQACEALQSLMNRTTLEQIPLLVLGNKNDLAQDAVSVERLITEMALKQVTNREVSCYSISAKERTNLDAVISWLLSKSK